jgi:hypothetical protein
MLLNAIFRLQTSYNKVLFKCILIKPMLVRAGQGPMHEDTPCLAFALLPTAHPSPQPPPAASLPPELLAVLDGRITQADRQPTALLKHLLEQQWLKAWVQLFAHVLNQHREAKLNAVLQLAHVVTIAELHDLRVLCMSGVVAQTPKQQL